MIRPVSASRPMCSFLHDRRILVPCFSISHSPAPQSLRPVLSTSRCNGSALLPAPMLTGRGTSSIAARRLRVVWSGTRSASPSRPMMEPIRPSVCRYARQNTARNVSAVRIARVECQGAHLGSSESSAAHAEIALSLNQTVRLARWRRLAS